MQEDVRCEVVRKGVEYTIPPDGAVCHLQISNDRQHLFSETEVIILQIYFNLRNLQRNIVMNYLVP